MSTKNHDGQDSKNNNNIITRPIQQWYQQFNVFYLLFI